MNKNFILAVSTLMGAIVGLGMFGIPYAASKAGFFVAVGYIFLLGIVTLLLHLIYGEVVERSSGRHRLSGYVEKYLGPNWKKLAGAVVIFSIYSTLLAYIIVGGKFLSLLVPGLASSFTSGIAFWLVLSLGIWLGIRVISGVELAMAILIVLFVGILALFAAGSIDSQNFFAETGLGSADVFLPYGVVLFAFSGVLAVPEIRELLKIDGLRYKRAILLGTLIPLPLYLVFTFLVVGVSGPETSQEALEGIGRELGHAIMRIGAVLGIAAISTTYLVIGSNLQHTLQYDWRMGRVLSKALVAVVPIVLYVSGFQQFIEVISFSGAVLGAMIAVLIIAIYMKSKTLGDKEPGYTLNFPKIVIYGLVALFALGGIYEIIYLLV